MIKRIIRVFIISLCFMLFFVTVCGCSDGTTIPPGDNNDDEIVDDLILNPGYTFYDDFRSSELNMDKWDFQNGDGTEYGVAGWGNREEQYYRPENLTIEDGNLVITAKREDYKNKKYTSSKIVTAGKFSQTYGLFEIRARLSVAEQGLWPAFWMMPQDSAYGGWPRSGEIDIMELKGRFPYETSSALHFGTPHTYRSDNYTFADGGEVTDFHIYGVEWREDKIQFLVDGEVYFTVNKNQWFTSFSGEKNSNAPFDKGFYMLVNLAVGGQFDGMRVPADDKMPARLEVDFVRASA